jgi:opacity protein-like surface antigen
MNWRSITIALLLSAGTFVLYGQVPASFGVKGGISLANQSYRFTPIDYEIETEPLTGAVVTLFVEAFKGDRFSFQLEVGYAVKGSSTTLQSVSVNHLDNDRITVHEGDASVSKFTYLTMAPLARYRFGLERLTPYILLGPRVDFLLKYESESDYPLEDQNGTILGLTCGAGLEFNLQNMGLFAELQYLPDLSPVTNEAPLLINNNMLSLTLGVRWIVSE